MTKLAKHSSITRVIETIHRLRAPGGCAWDRAQTHQTLRQYLIEEAHEVLDVLDQIHSAEDLKKEKIKLALKEELGDLLMQVILHSEMTEEAGHFSIDDVAAGLDEKLIRRHPHVFADQQAETADSAFLSWEKQKALEKSGNPNASILDGLPKGLPALQRAAKVIEKVTKVGFQWADMQGPLAKVEEELGEFKAEVLALEKAAPGSDEAQSLKKKVQDELGDLLFTLANVGYLMKINPEDTLREQLHRFESRFKHIERRLKENGKKPEDSDLAEMDRYWDEAKKLEKTAAGVADERGKELK
jgi:tetrapyrrole methylase family protein/MazG family protein